MSSIFLKLLNMSITASWLILAVILARLLLKKAPKWIPCVLWGLVAIRLICPFSFESIFSLIPSSETIPSNIALQNEPHINSGITVINEVVNPVISESFAPALDTSVNPLQVIIPIATTVWVAGLVVMLAYALVSYLKLKRTISVCVPIKEGILYCDEVKAPFILGVFRPIIYVPSFMQGETLDYVLRHENAHLQRHDHWWKPLGFLLLSVYWFNPLCWIAYILLCRDIEMACDEKVIHDMDKGDMAAYSQALLDCSFPRKRIVACPLAFGEVGVKERVKGVLNYKKPSFWIILAAILVCIVLAVSLLTNPKSSDTASTSVATSFEGDGYVGISYEGRRYVPFCAISNSARGELLGYIGDDTKDQIYTWKGYSPEEWIISFYHSGLMDTSMLMRETHVTDIPSQVTSEYSWNNTVTNNLSPGVDLNALREKYPEYFDLSTFKGLELYVWQMAQDSYSCGLMLGTNRNKTLEELMNLKGATVAEMRAILSTYDIDEKDIFVIPWQNPISSYLADYWISLENEDPASVERRKQEYVDRIRQMLFSAEQNSEYNPTDGGVDGPGSVTINIRADVCELYLEVLEDLWNVDPGLNDGISQIGIDLSNLSHLTETEKETVMHEFASKHNLPFIAGTWEELCEQGYIDKGNLYWEDGLFFSIKTNEDAGSAPERTTFDAQKWRSGLGAYFFGQCTAEKGTDGKWMYTVGQEAIS